MIVKVRTVLDVLARYEVVLREAEGVGKVFDVWGWS